jgi:hypothetical protein
MCFEKYIPLTADVPISNEIIGGWAGDQLDNLGNAITTGIYNGFISILNTLIDIVFWASEVGILCCIIVYIASKDNKAISLYWKLILAFLVAAVVKKRL